MMGCKHNHFILALLVSCLMVFSNANIIAQQTGIFESYIALKLNGGGNTFYDMQATTGNLDFQSANLGTFCTLNNSMALVGGEVKTFKNGTGNVTGARLFWRVYLTSGSAGSFNEFILPFGNNIGSSGDQSWSSQSGNIDILNGLVAGNYTFEVYGFAFTNLGDRFSNNSGNNYKATFTVQSSNTVTAASSAPFLCVNTAVTAISHATTGATGIGVSTGLPEGVTAVWANNTITISGTPSAIGTFAYTIPLSGGCGTGSAVGTITVNALPVPAIAGTTTGCGSVSLTASGGGTYAWSGGTSTNTDANTFTSSGTYTVTVTNSNNCAATTSAIVTVNPLGLSCVAPSSPLVAEVGPSNVVFTWPQGCYSKYRLMYRKVNLPNSAWTLKIVSGTTFSTSVPRTLLSPGTYAWGVRGLCYSTNNWSAPAVGTNFVVPVMTPTQPQGLVMNNINSTVITAVYPNPVKDLLLVQLHLTKDQACVVRLSDQLGRTVYGQHHEIDGTSSIRIPTGTLPAGIYFLNVIVDGKIQTERIVVAH